MNFKYISTEKAVKVIESQNKLLFIVDRKASKPEIKKEFEELFGVKIKEIKTYVRKNHKYASLSFKDSKAIDLATKLGVM